MKWLLMLAVIASVITLVIISKKRYFDYFYNACRRGAGPGGAAAAGGGAGKGVFEALKPGTAGSASWTFPLVLFTSILIAWGAEVGQFLVSQGMTLAVLAWLQVMPEFAVEAAISYEAAIEPEKIHLITANFTGSNRLLVGLGWPLIFFTALYGEHRRRKVAAGKVGDDIRKRIRNEKRKGRKADDPYIKKLETELQRAQGGGRPWDFEIILEEAHSVEVIGLLIPTIYFFVIWLKGTLTLWDSLVLIVIYVVYLYILNLLPPEEESKAKDMHGVAKKVLAQSKTFQKFFVVTVFIIGGLILFFIAEPFLHSLMALAAVAGISTFWFIQWVAPFMSEFPEKLSAFYWAKTVVHAPMAMMNMVSSKINQWTILVAMIPMVYCISLGGVADIHFDHEQRIEILLTIAQSLLAVVILLNMRVCIRDATMLFVLWFLQFAVPWTREPITYVYFILVVITLVYNRKQIKAFSYFDKTMRMCMALRAKSLAEKARAAPTHVVERNEWKEEAKKEPVKREDEDEEDEGEVENETDEEEDETMDEMEEEEVKKETRKRGRKGGGRKGRDKQKGSDTFLVD